MADKPVTQTQVSAGGVAFRKQGNQIEVAIIQVDGRWVSACVPITGLILLIHVACGLDLLEPLDPAAAMRDLIDGRQ